MNKTILLVSKKPDFALNVLIEYEDGFYLKDGKRLNYYDELEEELKEKSQAQIAKWKEELKTSSVYRKIINDKIREWGEELLEEKMYLHQIFKKRIGKTEQELIWLEWAIERSRGRIIEIEKKITSWQYKKQICLGKLKDEPLNIEKAKAVPIGNLLSGRGEGNNIRKFYCCPIHKEKTPSFCWFVESNHAKCFGCDWRGDSIDLYQKLNNVSFVEAVKILSKY